MDAFTIPAHELAERPDGYQGPNLSPRGLRWSPTGSPPEPTRWWPTSHPRTTTAWSWGSGPPWVNRDNMTDLADEKARRADNMDGDVGLLDAVTDWRRPDVVFDSAAEVDLGGRVVQLLCFGPGNGPGDTIVYLPDAKVAWTGNYLPHAGLAPMLLQGGPAPYLASLRRMRAALPELGTIVAGHGPPGDGHPAIDWLVGYLERLLHDVGEARRAGRNLRQTLETCPSPFADGLDPRVVAALARYQFPQDLVRQRLLELLRNLHRLNVLATYRALESAP